MTEESQTDLESTDDRVIKSKSGKPYRRQQDAATGMRQRGLSFEGHHIEQTGTAEFVIVKNQVTGPAKSIGGEGEYIPEEDRVEGDPPPEAPLRHVDNSANKGKKAADEQCFWVTFQSAVHTHEPVYVTLSVNGETLQIVRGKRIPLPRRFLECADHGVYPVYSQVEGEKRKIEGYNMFFPYSKDGEATYAEYRTMVAAGTAQNIKAAEQARHAAGVKQPA